MKTKRLFGLISLMTILVLLVAACGGGAQPAQQAPAEAPAEEAPAEEAMEEEAMEETGPVTLRFLTVVDPIATDAWNEILGEFQKIEDGKYAQVSLQFESVPFRELFPKIESSVAAGLPWDIVQADGPDMKHYGFNRVLIPVGEFYSDEELKQWFPQSVEEGSFRGELYGPPMMQSCSLLMYNRDMTDAAGISPPEALADAWTMDEAMEAWQNTTLDSDGDGVPNQWGVRWGQGTWNGDYEHGIFRRSNGEKGSLTYNGMGDDGVTFVGSVDSPEAVEAMQFYQDMHLKQQVTPIEAIPEIFESELAAFMVTPDNRIANLDRLHGEDGFNWGVTGIPYFKTPVCHTGSWHYGIAPNTENFEEALAFTKFAASDDGARIYYKHLRQLPANVGLFNELPEYSEDGRQRIWFDAMNEFGIPRIQTPGYTEYQQMFAEAISNIAQGADPQEQLSAAARRIEGLVAKYTGWDN